MTHADLERVVTDVAAVMAADDPAAAPAIERAEDGTAVSWSRGATTFAVIGHAGIEFRLDPRIAAAAARTPDAAPSGRGPDWVRFNPRELDSHAVDRLEAWFTLAARRAAEAKRPGSR